MLVAPEYHGLDLPIYDPSTTVVTTSGLKDPIKLHELTSGSTVDTFVRAADVKLFETDHAPKGLNKLLERTDQELEQVAELCDSLVVDHTWGLYPIAGKGAEYTDYLPDKSTSTVVSLPEDHILVAEVAFLKGAIKHMPRPRHSNVAEGLKTYYHEGLGQYQLYDMSPRQFVIENDDSPADKGVWLVDIEPRFKLISEVDLI